MQGLLLPADGPNEFVWLRLRDANTCHACTHCQVWCSFDAPARPSALTPMFPNVPQCSPMFPNVPQCSPMTPYNAAVQCRRTIVLSLFLPRPSPQSYLKSVLDGDLPQNNQVLYNLQDIFNLLPNLNLESLSQSMVTKTSDMHLVRLSPYHYWRRCCVTCILGILRHGVASL
jgi:hypothetical protein